MAIDIVARGLASSLVDSNGRIETSKMPVMSGTSELEGFTSIGHLTDASLIEGKTAVEILLMILFGIVNPTLVAPKLSIVLENENEVLIIGRPSVLKGALSFDRGKIDPANGTSGYRAGMPISYTINGHTSESTNTIYDFELEVTPTDRIFVLDYEVKYAAGEQPLDSAGRPFDIPLPAGALTGALECTAAPALYDPNHEEINFSWFKDEEGEGYSFIAPSETADSRQGFIVSSDVTVVGIKAFSPLTQTWEWVGSENAAISLTCFDVSLVEGETLGESNNYVKYTNNQPRSAERELRVYVQ